MSSRQQARNKPYWKRHVKQQAGYVREFAYDKDGVPVMEDGYYVTKLEDGTLEYEKDKQIYRDRPNRALVRRVHADNRKAMK